MLIRQINQGSVRQDLMAAGVLVAAAFLALYFPSRDDTVGATVGAALAFCASAIGFAAVGRVRPLPKRRLGGQARLMGLSLMMGTALGLANLIVHVARDRKLATFWLVPFIGLASTRTSRSRLCSQVCLPAKARHRYGGGEPPAIARLTRRCSRRAAGEALRSQDAVRRQLAGERRALALPCQVPTIRTSDPELRTCTNDASSLRLRS